MRAVFGASIEEGMLIIDGVPFEGALPECIEMTMRDGMTITFPARTVHSWEEAIRLGIITPAHGYRRDCECSVCTGAGHASVLTSTVTAMTPDPDIPISGHDLVTAVDAGEDAEVELVDWLRDQPWSDFAKSLVAFYDDRGFLSPKQVDAATRMRVKCEAKEKKAADPVTEDGMYLHPDGTVYKVQIAVHGSGRLYAKRLVIPDDPGVNATFEMDQGAIRRLTPEMKMGLEQAQAFGSLYGVCCVCGAVLTDDSPGGSIEQGIGPVCRTRV